MLLLLPQGVAAVGTPLATQASLVDALYRLGFQSAADLNQSDWLTAAELNQWANRAVKHLAVRTGIFVTFDDSITVAPGTAQYDLPEGHIYTVLAAVGTKLLWITSVGELWALDTSWAATDASNTADELPERASLDAGGLGTITLYPIPVAAGTIAQVLQQMPVGENAQATMVLPLNPILQAYITDAMLEGARRKESDHRAEDMADHYAERMKLFEAVCENLWGPRE